MDTQTLVNKCINGDTRAWDEFARRYAHLIRRSVIYKMNRLAIKPPKSDLDDIIQEILFSIWDKNQLSNLKSIDSLDAWLVMISVNKTANYCRRRSLAEINALSLDKITSDDHARPLKDIIPSSKFDTAQIMKNNEFKDLLEAEINKLGSGQQLAIRLNLYEGKKQRDISKIMNIPLNTVSTLIRRAKNTIREGLEDFLKN